MQPFAGSGESLCRDLIGRRCDQGDRGAPFRSIVDREIQVVVRPVMSAPDERRLLGIRIQSQPGEGVERIVTGLRKSLET